MKSVIKSLRGNMSLNEALQHRINNISEIAKREKFSFKVKNEAGYSQTLLYPKNDSEKDFTGKRK